MKNNIPLSNFTSLHKTFFRGMTHVIEPKKETWTQGDERIFSLFFAWCKEQFPEDDAHKLAIALPGLLELPLVLDRFEKAIDRENYKNMLLRVDYDQFILFTANVLEKTRLDHAVQLADVVFNEKLGDDELHENITRFHSLNSYQKLQLGRRMQEEVRSFCLKLMTVPAEKEFCCN